MPIDTLLFDFGAVLYEWNPTKFVTALRKEPAEQQVLFEIIDGKHWVAMDRGEISQDVALRNILHDLAPAFHADATKLVREWYTLGSPLPEMHELARNLIDEGYHVYLLSNINETFHRIRKAGVVPVLEDFDGLALSFELGAVKPDPKIYARTCEKFSLIPEQCFFIDDRADNIKAAEDFGMTGHVFTGDVQALRSALATVGVNA